MQSEKVKIVFHWGRKKKRFLCHKNKLKSKIAKRLDLAAEFSLEVLKKDTKEWVPVSPSDLGDTDEVRVANLEEILKSEGDSKVNGVSEDEEESSSDEEMCDTLRKKLKENIALDASEKRFLCDVLWCRPKRQMRGSAHGSLSDDSYRSECDCKRRKMEDKNIQTVKDDGDDDDEDEEKTSKPGRGRPRRETSDKKEKEEVKKPQRGRPKKSSTTKQEDEEEDMEVETAAKKKSGEIRKKGATKSSDAEAADDEDDDKQEKKEAKKDDEPKASKGRGRPRKSTAMRIEEPEDTDKEVGAKKSRGRKNDDKARGAKDESHDDKESKEEEAAKESDESKDIFGKPKTPVRSPGNSKMGISGFDSLFSSEPVKFQSKDTTSKDKDDGGLSSGSDLHIELKTKSPSPDKKDKDKQKTDNNGMFSSSSGSEFAVEVIPNKKKPGELAMSSDSDDETFSSLKGKKKGKEKKGRGRKKKEESSDAGSDYEPPKAKNYDEGSSESDTEAKKGKRRSSARVVKTKSSASPKKGRRSAAADRKKSSASKKRKKGDESASDTDDDSSGKRKSRRQSKAPKTYAERDSSGASDKDVKSGRSSTKRKSRANKSLREEASSEKSESEEKSDSEPRGKKKQRKTKSEGKKKKDDTPKTSKKSAYKQVKEMRERMIAELKKDSPDDDEIRKLMDETFKARQDYILNDMPRIKVVRETYPALFNIKEVIREFNRIKEEDNFKKYKKNLETYADIVLENVPSTSSPVVDIVKEKLDEDLSDEEKDYVKSAAVILLLPTYLKEDVRNFISFVKVTESVFPLITCSVPVEKVLSSDARFTILVEMHKLCTSASLVEAFFAFISAFYIFNIEFPEECTQTISVIESLLLEITSEVCLSKEAKSAKKLLCNKLKENEKHAVSAKKGESCGKENDSSKQNDDDGDKASKEVNSDGEDRNSDTSEKNTEKKDSGDERKKDGGESSDQ